MSADDRIAMSSRPFALIGICRAHGHWFQIAKVHEPCPEPGCQAACDYYERIPDSTLKVRAELDRARA